MTQEEQVEYISESKCIRLINKIINLSENQKIALGFGLTTIILGGNYLWYKADEETFNNFWGNSKEASISSLKSFIELLKIGKYSSIAGLNLTKGSYNTILYCIEKTKKLIS